jgi:hypothetical protein
MHGLAIEAELKTDISDRASLQVCYATLNVLSNLVSTCPDALPAWCKSLEPVQY